MEEHDEVVVFYHEEPQDGEYSATFAILDYAGASTVELEEREGGLDAQEVDRGFLHSIGENTRNGRMLKVTLSELDKNDRDRIINAVRYDMN